MTTPALPAAAPPPAVHRPAVRLQTGYRVAAAVAAVASLGDAFVLGWRDSADGTAVAAAFVTGFLFASFALAGVVPSSIKVGDVELSLQQAKDAGRVEGIGAGTHLAAQVASGQLGVDEVSRALHTALTTDADLQVDGVHLPVPRLSPQAAEQALHTVVAALQVAGRGADGRAA